MSFDDGTNYFYLGCSQCGSGYHGRRGGIAACARRRKVPAEVRVNVSDFVDDAPLGEKIKIIEIKNYLSNEYDDSHYFKLSNLPVTLDYFTEQYMLPEAKRDWIEYEKDVVDYVTDNACIFTYGEDDDVANIEQCDVVAVIEEYYIPEKID